MKEKPPEPVFPWNDLIGMTNGSEERPVIIALAAVFDAIEALRWDLNHQDSPVGADEPVYTRKKS